MGEAGRSLLSILNPELLDRVQIWAASHCSFVDRVSAMDPAVSEGIVFLSVPVWLALTDLLPPILRLSLSSVR